MEEKKTTGRKKFEGKRVPIVLNKRTEEMLTNIQEYIGATSTSETMRFLINDYYKSDIIKEKK